MLLAALILAAPTAALHARSAPKMMATLDVKTATTTSGGDRVVAQWSPSSWRAMKVMQDVEYPDKVALEAAEAELGRAAPLVFAGEVRTLQEQLARATLGDGFVLMGGDCAESFEEFSVNNVRDSFRVILQMALTMTYGSGQPIIKIGRMAGQFAKPRSKETETRDGVTLPSYRGDNVNAEPFTKEARTPDPQRMVRAYNQCAQTLNILRAFAVGGYADISRLHAWNLDFMESTREGSMYRSLAWKIDESLRFMRAIGIDTTTPALTQTAFYTAHECLLLPYEQALTRQDSTTGRWYDCSAHLLWVGERTRQPGCAHFEFVRGISNPLGVKVSDKATPEDVLKILDDLNPQNIPGRITLITRMGAANIREKLPPLVRAVRDSGRAALWVSDPVHGNTFESESGFKTRSYDAIKDELVGFFEVHAALGTHAGGVHLEMTGQDVTECVGGTVGNVADADLSQRYLTACDPRLNGRQALELAFEMAELMRKAQGLPRLGQTPDVNLL
ncbi:DAHP synthetase [Pelagophyceae sp. CCMP2097]|nr:DAHP synthetase [Pelagophyceae sp. CCMP2097]